MNFVISLPICNLSKLNLANTKDSMNNSISVSQISNLKSQISNLKSQILDESCHFIAYL